MVTTVVHLTSMGRGLYKLPEAVVFYPDEPIDSLDTLLNVQQERGKLQYKGKTYMITVYVEVDGDTRGPHMLISDLERLKG